MTDKHCKPSVMSGDYRVTGKDTVTECSEDFIQSLDTIPSHPSFIQPLLEQGDSEDARKLLRKIRQEPEWKKRVGKMLSFESHTLKGRLSWEQDKLKEQKKWLSSQKEEGESTHSGQLRQISELKQELREQMTNRIKLEINLAEDKRVNKKLIEDTNKAAKPKQKLSEVLNRTGARDNQTSVTQLEPSADTVCYTETDELTSVQSSPASKKLVLSPSHSESTGGKSSRRESPRKQSPSHSERPSSRESTGSKSSRKHSLSPSRSSKLSYSLSEAISQQAPSAAQSQTLVKFPKITNSPLISTQEPSITSPPLSKDIGVPCEDSALSIKSKCSHCGVKKPRKSPHDQTLYSGHTQEYQHSPSSFYSHGPAYHNPTLPSHNLHMSSPPVMIQHAPIPYTYLQPCHECVPPPQYHCHTQHHCSPCSLHKEDTSRFNQEFEHLKEFIREEIRSGWTKSPKSRRVKTYNYTASETSTASETELEDPYVMPSSNVSHPSQPYKRWKGQEMDSSHSLAATHSIKSKQSEVSSILEDELFLKLVSNPAKYNYELQEIAKLLTSPPISRASSTTSRQKLSAIKHLVREAICSYSTSELDSSDAIEDPQTEESEENLSRLDHVSSRTIHKARKAKEMKGECAISPKPSILKTSSRLSERDIAPCVSLTGLKRVNFSSETIDIDDGLPTQLHNIPDDYVVVEQDEIALATQEIREAEQTAQEIETDQSSTHLAYPYDQYIAGELAEPYTIVQSLDKSVGPSDSHASNEGGRADAASRLLSELGIESDNNSKLSVSHSLELKASLPSIPSYISETESRNSVSSRPNRPVQESGTTPSLLSNSRSSLNQVTPQRDEEDQLEAEKRSNRSREVLGDTVSAEDVSELVELHPRRSSRSNSVTQEHELRRNSMGQMSRLSFVSRHSILMNTQQQPLPEEVVPTKIEKQSSKSSLASRIFSTFSSIVSLKPSGSKTSVAEQDSIHSNVSNLSLASNQVENNESIREMKKNVSHANIDTSTLEKSRSNLSRPVSRQEEIQKANSSMSKSGSRQEEIQKAESSVSKSGSRQEEIQKANSSMSKSGSRQEEIQKAESSVSKSGSRQEEIQKANSSMSKSGSRQEEIQKAESSVSKSGSRQEEIQKANSSVSKSGSRQEEIQKANSSMSKSGSRQEEIQKANSSVSKSGSRQEEIQKANSSMSKSGSRQEEIQKANSSMSKSGSRQEEIQKAESSVSKSGSRQEEIQKANSSMSKSGSRQEEIQKAESSMSKSGSRQEEIQKAESSMSKSGSRQEEIQKAESSVSKSGSKQDPSTDTPLQCECTDCPDPTQCIDCSLPISEGTPEAQTNTDTIAEPVTNETEVPVKIVLSPEADTSKSVEEDETDMGVVMKFSEEWKIICTKDCPSGVEETTITDWREPSAIPQGLEKSESAPTSRVSSEEFPHDTQIAGIATRSLDSIEDQPNTVPAVPDRDTVTAVNSSLVCEEDTAGIVPQDETEENIHGAVETVPERVEEDSQQNNPQAVVSDNVEDSLVDRDTVEPAIHSTADNVGIETTEETADSTGKENDDVTELYSTITAQIVTEALESITRQVEQSQREDTAPESNDNLQEETQEISLPDTKQA